MSNPQLDPSVQEHTLEGEESVTNRGDPPRVGRSGDPRLSKDSRVHFIPFATAASTSLITDLIFFGLVLLITGAAEWEWIKNVQVRGYFRDDRSIQYPYLKTDSLSATLVAIVTIVVPLITFVAVELILLVRIRYIDRWRFKRSPLLILQNLIQTTLIFCLGYVLTLLFTLILKNYTGRLRPDFISRCQPDYSLISPDVNYISPDLQDTICTGDAKAITEGRKSFPSGHACVAVYAMLFAGAYLSRLRTRILSTNLIPVIQYVLIIFSILSTITRVTDNVHHPSDLIIGYVLGIVAFFYFEIYVRKRHVIPVKHMYFDPKEL
mmetsp:Transcript_11338/g.42507  ORF Transcript_11338/g.42507 Transcript_11338/m.42507 type:complete len:322 (+) Transcript_11338:92-1057(+)